MCGIFSILSNTKIAKDSIDYLKFNKSFEKGYMRGPENSCLKLINDNLLFGFHRLAINGLDDISNQPIQIEQYTLICNGEIYNYKELYKLHGFTPKTNSDCEIIIHLCNKFGIHDAITKLDGVFAFVLFDEKLNNIYVGRDPFGVRPVYFGYDKNMIAFASEIKVLNDCFSKDSKIEHFKPGTYSCYTYEKDKWISVFKNELYYDVNSINYSSIWSNKEEMYSSIREKLISSVKKRVLTTDRPIACLLSGGLDSSLICALVQREISYLYPGKKVETYSIGLEGSEDLYYAQKAADYIGTNHTSIVLDELTFLNAIQNVIKAVESFDTTTIRASVGNYLVSKYISEHSNAKVIFNGDGADELMGGYMYFHACPSSKEFDNECKRLLENIHNYDVLRSDKSISSWGLEARTPLLDKEWVRFYLQLPIEERNHNLNNNIEKYLVRKSFSYSLSFQNGDVKNILPDEILWRKKEAFSDGVSKQTRSWYQIIQESMDLIDDLETIRIPEHVETNGQPITLEQQYYYMLFHTYYPGRENILKYYWMPKYVDSYDSSARTLDVYNKKKQDISLENNIELY
tara:strand:+ start:14052 stop:15770 length:1719 start_codon:yes stop_codon:yes gene_type:complete